MLLSYGVASFLWPFASMNQREVLATGGKTLSDTLHLVVTGVTVLCNLLTIGFGAVAFGRRLPVLFYSDDPDTPGVRCPDGTGSSPGSGIYKRIGLLFASFEKISEFSDNDETTY